jgi:NOL1/NOP2/fmu family ribosome biogenesis protein
MKDPQDPLLRKGLKFLEERFGLAPGLWDGLSFHRVGDDYWITTADAVRVDLPKIRRRGLRFLRTYRGPRFKWTTTAMMLFGTRATRNVVELSPEEAERFVRGEDLKRDPLPPDCTPGQVILRYQGQPLGSGLLHRDGRIKNQLPAGRRLPRLRIVRDISS